MLDKKFLTVYGVFDANTQQILQGYQNTIKTHKLQSSHTEIPYHISFGSFAVCDVDALIGAVNNFCNKEYTFTVNLTSVEQFGTKVVYLKPQINNNISKLHSLFNSNYANGYDYVPHVTMFMSNGFDVVKVTNLLTEIFLPFSGEITELHIGEFFPPKLVYSKKLLRP